MTNISRQIRRFTGRAALVVASLAAIPAWAQETINVYGPGGPAPAMQEAAKTFAAANNRVTVNVVAGPTPQWLDKAKQDADVIFSGAENMFTDYAKALPGAFELKDAYPLVLRPVSILVRPGNPKGIRGFRDLLKPGTKVLTVAGAGQNGLWEDVAGRTGDIGMVRALRANIVFPEAANSGAAKQQWTEQGDIDAWLIWNIWQVANPKLADVVEMDEPFRIYRDAGVVLTKKGRELPQARAFVDFLKSPAGQAIFVKWGWKASATKVSAAAPGAGSQSSSHPLLQQRFTRIDRNHDGFLSWHEAAPLRAGDFDAMDANQDRRVSKQEFRGQQPFASFDWSRDGAVTKGEFLATHRAMFLMFDVDADQRISADEFAQAKKASPIAGMKD